MVGVDVADHRHPQVERLLAAQLVEPRLQHALVDAAPSRRRSARAPACGAGLLIVQQEAVAVVGLERFEREQSSTCLVQTDCRARSTSTMPRALEARLAAEIGGACCTGSP